MQDGIEQLYKQSDSLHWWLLAWTFIVVLGVAVEVMLEGRHIDWRHLLRGFFREHPGHRAEFIILIAGALVAIGICGEFWCEMEAYQNESKVRMMSDTSVANANERAAKASESAAKAIQSAEQAKKENTGLKKQLAEAQLATLKIRERIAASEKDIQESKVQVAKANQRTEEMRAESITLQKAMAPRFIPANYSRSQPGLETSYPELDKYAGTKVIVQSVADTDARRLAQDLEVLLSRHGWKPQPVNRFVPDFRHYDLLPFEYIWIQYTIGGAGDKAVDTTDVELLKLLEATKALEALVKKAGLPNKVLTSYHSNPPSPQYAGLMTPMLDPSFKGLYVVIGYRPIDQNLGMLEEKRRKQARPPSVH